MTSYLALSAESLTWIPEGRSITRNHEEAKSASPISPCVRPMTHVDGSVPLPFWWFSSPQGLGLSWRDTLDRAEIEVKTNQTLGYLNDGNTCFANSVLQMLNYVPTLFHLSHGLSHTRSCPKRDENLFCGCCLWEKHLVKSWGNAETVENLFKHLPSHSSSRGSHVPILLKSLRKSHELKACRMRPGAQHCAHEFFLALMRYINRNEIPRDLESAYLRGALCEHESSTTLYSQAMTHPKIMRKVCLNCKHVTADITWNYDITIMPNELRHTIELSLSKAFEGGLLGDGALCKCDGCHRKDVKKSTTSLIGRLPPVLPICLQRTHMSNHRLKKNEIHVTIQETLDMRPYCIPSDSSKFHAEDYLYDLSSFVRHSGGPNGGHYIAYGHNGYGKWFRCDDSLVTPVDKCEALSEANRGAFILCYSKKTPVQTISLEDPGWLPLKKAGQMKAEEALKNVAKGILFGNDPSRVVNGRGLLGLTNLLPPPTAVMLYSDILPFLLGRAQTLLNAPCLDLDRSEPTPPDGFGFKVRFLEAEEDTHWVAEALTPTGRYIADSSSIMFTNQDPEGILTKSADMGEEEKEENNKPVQRISNIVLLSKKHKKRNAKKARLMRAPKIGIFREAHSGLRNLSKGGWSDSDEDRTINISSDISKSMKRKLHFRDEHDLQLDRGKVKKPLRQSSNSFAVKTRGRRLIGTGEIDFSHRTFKKK
eukprot:GHVH01006405.1.p1 GENE.GHVH01006405.1~~GHVH01006405.1.p1  ORF type:complete len:706 (-),score=94.40 GHVH01006405.1:1680-3797(-)